MESRRKRRPDRALKESGALLRSLASTNPSRIVILDRLKYCCLAILLCQQLSFASSQSLLSSDQEQVEEALREPRSKRWTSVESDALGEGAQNRHQSSQIPAANPNFEAAFQGECFFFFYIKFCELSANTFEIKPGERSTSSSMSESSLAKSSLAML